ncbi:amino acid permease [Tundrisphaera lichenicola]|uniref:amino acid permease n=1 Tax=Tundrisphaera lichenicola TaxID=2029860 RepID=UPI003EB6C33D
MGRRPSSLFARKPIETLLQEVEGGERLNRVLGPVALTALGVGATIGAGIFVLTGQAARNDAGPSLILSFVLAGIGCLFAALCYAEMASMVPVAGSGYTYAYATMGELVAWIIGWDLVLEYAIGSSVVAVGWSQYLAALFRDQFHLAIDPRWLNAPWDFDLEHHAFLWKQVEVVMPDGSTGMAQAYFNLPALMIVAAITVILVVGIRESASFNLAMVLVNLCVILLVIGLGSTYVEPKNWSPFLHKDHGWKGIPLGAAHIFFAYIGFDSISTHAEEARNPKRDLAIGILASLTICTILYVSVAAVITGMVPYLEIDVKAPIASAFVGKGSTWAAGLITGSILAGITSALLVSTLSQPRILLAMARDGMLPVGFFGAVHPKFLTPWKATILVGLIVGSVSALVPLDLLADLVSVGTLFAFLMVCVSVLILRARSPEVPRPFRVKGLPFVAGMGILLNGGLMFSLGPDNWIRLIVWLALGLVIYFGYGRYHTHLKPATDQEIG